MNASSFLQLQTQAAHQPRRPLNRPLQPKGSVDTSPTATSDTSRRSSTDWSPSPSADHARCSRCHRGVSMDSSMRSMSGISIGINSYYCRHCATLVYVYPDEICRMSNFCYWANCPIDCHGAFGLGCDGNADLK